MTDGGRLGFEHPVFHATFYPNWGEANLHIYSRQFRNNRNSSTGTNQPGCGNDLVGQCGHFLVSQFYAASVNPSNVFGAIRCRNLDDIRQRNCVVSGTSRRMGGEPLMDGPGIVGSVYFLTTDGVFPFAHGPR